MISFESAFLFLIAVLLAIVSTPIYLAWRDGNLDPFEPILLKSVFMAMVVIELFNRVYLSPQSLDHRGQVTRSFSEAFLLLGVLYVALYVSTLLGYYANFDFDGLTDLFPSAEQYRISSLKIISALYLLVGVVSYTYLVGSAFDWNLLYMYSTTTPRSQVFGGTRATLLRMISKGMYIGFFLWVVATVAEGNSLKLRHLVVFPFIVGAIALLGGRGLTIRVGLTFVITLYYLWEFDYISTGREYLTSASEDTNQILKLAGVFVFGLGVALSMILLRSFRQAEGLIDSLRSIDVVNLLTSGIHTDKFDNFILLLEFVPEQIGYYYGTLYLRVVTNFIPRGLWSGKPSLTIGSELRRAALPAMNGGRSPGELGVYFANFGYPGIVVCGIAYGILLRLLYESLTRNKGSPLAIVVFALVSIPLVVSGLTNNALWEIFVDLLWLSPALLIHTDFFQNHSPLSR